ncbi:MAG: hypothetical protein KatS3mg002_1074 [Candidatus Woesearchaeota archaeon]|nr:MAG: hypothetical protein KatS3mg002_1074 [Candidatus Woesearchaeota archaeon]
MEKQGKLQQYLIYKFNSSRLKKKKYKIEIGLEEAIRGDEVISLGESEAIRQLYRMKGIENPRERVEQLYRERRVIEKLGSSYENRKRIKEINREIERLTFISEIVNVKIENISHYREIMREGLWINGREYVRFMVSAGMARRSTVQFIDKEYIKLREVLENGIDKSNLKMVYSKYNAYFALASSATYRVSTPRIGVIRDYEYEVERLVEYIREVEGQEEDEIEEKVVKVKVNAFDGQGLVSPEMAGVWSRDLGLRYIPNSFCIRANWIKGQAVVFDFKKFAEKRGIYKFVDIWGTERDIREIDVILTESQFKLWNAYKNLEEYLENCEKNKLGWGISRYTPQSEKEVMMTSYQLLQVLDLGEEELEDLVEDTLDWLRGINLNNPEYTILYLLGEVCNHRELEKEKAVEIFEKIEQSVVKGLLLDWNLLKDNYLKRYIHRSLEKKIREVKFGKLQISGNWQVAIADPYAFCEHLLGLEVKGLLKEGEHYCKYWMKKGVKEVASGRSPLTWKSEMNILHFREDEEIRKWFSHLESGIVFNIHGIDTMLMADSDFDYDIVFSTDNYHFIKGASGGLPITYEKKTPEKKEIIEDELYTADIDTMGSKIGYITNIGTTLYCMLDLFEEGSREYNEIIKRLKLIRKAQGNEIDRGKGILVKPFPSWDKYKKVTDGMKEEEIEKIKLWNRIVVNRRPRFMIYLYNEYMKKHRNHWDIYNNYVESLYNIDLNNFLEKDEYSEYEQNILKKYNEFNPYIDSNSNMGIICRYAERESKEIKFSVKKGNYNILEPYFIYKKEEINPNLYRKLKEIYKKYWLVKREDGLEGIKIEYFQRKLLELFGNVENMLYYCSYFAYFENKENYTKKDFFWKLVGDKVIEFLIEKGKDSMEIMLLDEYGDVHYLRKRYSKMRIGIGKGIES